METVAIALTWSLFRLPHRATSPGLAITHVMTTVPTIGMTDVPTTAMHAGTATGMACLTVTATVLTIRIVAERDSDSRRSLWSSTATSAP